MTYHGVEVQRDQIAQFCRRHRIRRLSLFGSILREDFGPDSDIDVLVEFEPGQTPGLAFLQCRTNCRDSSGDTLISIPLSV